MTGLVSSATAQQNIVAQARDVVVISASSESSISGRYRVSENGSIYLPTVGAVNVMLRNTVQIELALKTAMRERLGILDDLSVQLATDKHSGIAIGGAVAKPMLLRRASGVTLDQLIEIIPLLEFADQQGAQIYDIAGRVAKVQYPVRPGDRISISVKQQIPSFTVAGGVNKVGAFDLAENMTLFHAITLAGGIGSNGDPKRIFIDRALPVGPLDLAKDGSVPLKPGDSIRVGLKSDLALVTVAGFVAKPINLEWTNDLTVFSALAKAGGVLDQRLFVVVSSTVNSKKKPVKFAFADIAKGKAKDFLLEPGDLVDVVRK